MFVLVADLLCAVPPIGQPHFHASKSDHVSGKFEMYAAMGLIGRKVA